MFTPEAVPDRAAPADESTADVRGATASAMPTDKDSNPGRMSGRYVASAGNCASSRKPTVTKAAPPASRLLVPKRSTSAPPENRDIAPIISGIGRIASPAADAA